MNQTKIILWYFCIIFSLLILSWQVPADHFFYLDLKDEGIRDQIILNYEKIENERKQNFYNIEVLDNETLANDSRSELLLMLQRIDQNEVISETEYSLIINIIAESENLAQIFFKKLATSNQLKVFGNILDRERQLQVLEIFKSNFTLLKALREEGFLKNDKNREMVLEHFFNQGLPEINRILLEKINLKYWKRQRCILKRVIELRNLRDEGKYELTYEQKLLLIPIILKSNSLCRIILEDKWLVPI